MTPPTVCYPILPWVFRGGVLADSALGAAFSYHEYPFLAAHPSIFTECTTAQGKLEYIHHKFISTNDPQHANCIKERGGVETS